MTADPRQFSPMFSIDVTANNRPENSGAKIDANEMIVMLLRQLVEGQQKQMKVLEEMSHHLSHNHKQRQHDIGQWKEANPDLARGCRIAAEALVKVQNQFIYNLTEEVIDNRESLADSDFMVFELVDRFGPRISHLNGLLQVLSQLSINPAQPNSEKPKDAG